MIDSNHSHCGLDIQPLSSKSAPSQAGRPVPAGAPIRAASASAPCFPVPTKHPRTPNRKGIRDVNTNPEDTRRLRLGLG